MNTLSSEVYVYMSFTTMEAGDEGRDSVELG